MSDQSRRKLLKSLAAGSGAIVAGKSLPESWSRPVVDSVMLPAHAQTSPAPTPPAGRIFGSNVRITAIDSDSENMFADLSKSLVPDAHANGYIYTGCAMETSTGVDFWLQRESAPCVELGEGWGSLPLSGEATIDWKHHICGQSPDSGTDTGTIKNIDDTSITLAFKNFLGGIAVILDRSDSCGTKKDFQAYCNSCSD